jgi:hypothetical protein
VTLIGVGKIAGNTPDRSGLAGTYTSALGETILANQFGSFGSAIAYTGSGNRYYATNDRGFGDGTTRSVDRFDLLDIVVDPAARRVDAVLVGTRFLTNESGESLIGLSSAFTADPVHTLRFDPEGIRVGPLGTLFISDEYGPAIGEFTASGRRIRSLPIPAKFRVSRPDADEETETRSNRTGRVTNRPPRRQAAARRHPGGQAAVPRPAGPPLRPGH